MALSICPGLGEGDIGSIELALAARTDAIDVKTLLNYPFWEDPALEDVAGISAERFYALMVSDQPTACFLMP